MLFSAPFYEPRPYNDMSWAAEKPLAGFDPGSIATTSLLY